MMSFCRGLLFFQSRGSFSFSGQLDSTIFLQRFGELSTSLSSPLNSSMMEIVYIQNKIQYHVTLQCKTMCSKKCHPHHAVIIQYLNGSPGMWREECHSTGVCSFNWEMKQELKLLEIKKTQTEENLRKNQFL